MHLAWEKKNRRETHHFNRIYVLLSSDGIRAFPILCPWFLKILLLVYKLDSPTFTYNLPTPGPPALYWETLKNQLWVETVSITMSTTNFTSIKDVYAACNL